MTYPIPYDGPVYVGVEGDEPELVDAPGPAKCPRCDSPSPTRHPAVQFEGEVQVCPDPFHASTEDGRKMLAQASPLPEGRADGRAEPLRVRWWQAVRSFLDENRSGSYDYPEYGVDEVR